MHPVGYDAFNFSSGKGVQRGWKLLTASHPAAAAGDGDLQESLINFSINAAALAVFGFLVYRDYSKQQQDIRQIEREEALGRLQVLHRHRNRVLPQLQPCTAPMLGKSMAPPVLCAPPLVRPTRSAWLHSSGAVRGAGTPDILKWGH